MGQEKEIKIQEQTSEYENIIKKQKLDYDIEFARIKNNIL